VGTAAIELSIPILLVIRRTRNLGVVVGLVFHALLALDRHHQFFDFSSVLTALFVLFLPASSGTWVAERLGSVRARLALADDRLPALAGAGAAAVPTAVGLAVVFDLLDPPDALEVGWWSWQVYVLGVIPLTLRYLDQRPPTQVRGALRPGHLVYALVPLLVLANGLTPYLEVKTGYGWNMYANLRTVDGETNHYVLPRTLPVTDEQADLVVVISSSDVALERYGRHGYALTWMQLRDYLSDHREVSLTYRRGLRTVALDRAADDPALVEDVPDWWVKLRFFRPIDEESPERCVPLFGPAR
jgi:hypothetical protein